MNQLDYLKAKFEACIETRPLQRVCTLIDLTLIANKRITADQTKLLLSEPDPSPEHFVIDEVGVRLGSIEEGVWLAVDVKHQNEFLKQHGHL